MGVGKSNLSRREFSRLEDFRHRMGTPLTVSLLPKLSKKWSKAPYQDPFGYFSLYLMFSPARPHRCCLSASWV